MPPPPYNYEYWKKYGVSSPQDPFLSAVRDLFVGHQKGTPTPANLKRFWDVAFQLGKKSFDIEEEKKILEEKFEAQRQETFEDGRKVGFKEGRCAGYSEGKIEGAAEAKKVSSGYSEGYSAGWKAASEQGEQRGINKESVRWVELGHSLSGACQAGHSVARVAVAIATDPPQPPPTVICASTATQTVANNDQESVTDYRSHVFNWADDIESVPIIHSTPSRDINALCTKGVSKPFASLQRRVGKPRNSNHKNRPCDSQDIYLGSTKQEPVTPRIAQRPRQRRQASQHAERASQPSTLDWVRDPRLSRLAQALQDLGWFFPQRFG